LMRDVYEAGAKGHIAPHGGAMCARCLITHCVLRIHCSTDVGVNERI
jgi:hypothetical protein